MNLDKFRPLGSNHLIRFTDAPDKTESGLFLPDSMRENYYEAEVLASGPGGFVPVGDTFARWRAWARPGDTILIQKHTFIPLESGGKIGIVDDENILGNINNKDVFFPRNDWVKICPDEWENETKGGILIPEEYRHRPKSGTIWDYGPGRMIKYKHLAGLRMPVRSIMGVDEDKLLVGSRVYWGDQTEVLEIGQSTVSFVLIRAKDLDCMECDYA